ncbi:MAG: ATP-binding protein [Mycobacterium sp.]
MSSGHHTLNEVHATLDDCWSSHGHVPESVRMEVAIAVGEIVANIVEHASQGDNIDVTMSIEVLADKVHINLTDDGAACPIDLDSALMPDEFADRGRGIAMVRAVLSKLSYHRSATHNHWRLISRSFA